MRTILLTVFISLLNSTISTAQDTKEIAIDVAGLNPYTNITDTEIRQALGQPTRFSINRSELGEEREYQYGPQEKYDLFRYQDSTGCLEFTLETSTFSLFEGRISVGKSISDFQTLTGGLLKKQSQSLYYFYPAGKLAEDYLEIHTNNNTIIRIIFNSPI